MKKTIAIILLPCLLLTACSENLDNDNITEYEQTTTPPVVTEAVTTHVQHKVRYVESLDEAKIGESVKFNQVSCGGFSAWVEMREIKTLPEGENDYYTAGSVCLCLCDQSGKTLIAPFPCDGAVSENAMIVQASALENLPQIFEMKEGNKTEYLLMQEVSSMNGLFPDIVEKDEVAAFYYCGVDADGDMGQLPGFVINPADVSSSKARLTVDGNDCANDYYIAVSDSFKYVERRTFEDTDIGYTITFDPEKYSAKAEALSVDS